MTEYSLAQLTVLEASPPELIRIASAAGYDYVGVRLLEVTGGDAWPLSTDAALMRETRAAMRDHGVGVLDVELVRLTPDINVTELRRTIEAAAELGARHVLTQAHDPEWSRLVQNFGALCDLLLEYRMRANIEFLTWTAMRCVGDAAELIRASGRANVGITVDTLHFNRSNCSLEQFDGLPPTWFQFMQICDAPAVAPTTIEGLIFAAREDRLIPGEGGLDLAGVIRRLPEKVVVAVEIPNTALARKMSNEDRAKLALEGTKRLVDQVRAERRDPSLPTQTEPR